MANASTKSNPYAGLSAKQRVLLALMKAKNGSGGTTPADRQQSSYPAIAVGAASGLSSGGWIGALAGAGAGAIGGSEGNLGSAFRQQATNHWGLGKTASAIFSPGGKQVADLLGAGEGGDLATGSRVHYDAQGNIYDGTGNLISKITLPTSGYQKVDYLSRNGHDIVVDPTGAFFKGQQGGPGLDPLGHSLSDARTGVRELNGVIARGYDGKVITPAADLVKPVASAGMAAPPDPNVIKNPLGGFYTRNPMAPGAIKTGG